MDDKDAYKKYPNLRKWFNKLWVAELMKYNCGPCGTAPEQDTYCIIRPIYNLSGMGLGAHAKEIKAGDISATPPGYFWCEYFTGHHYSVDYEWVLETNPYWNPISSYIGVNRANFTKFDEWYKTDYTPEFPTCNDSFANLPIEFRLLSEVKKINVEFKGNSIIEVHLRTSDDPKYDHLIPIWKSTRGDKYHWLRDEGYQFIESYDDADGFLTDPRVGFFVK